MKFGYILPFVFTVATMQANAEDFGYLTKGDELFCRVDNIFPKENADKDGCVFFRYAKYNNYMGYSTTRGKIIIPPIYRTLSDNRQNPNYLIATKYIGVSQGKLDELKRKYGMLDKANHVIIPFEYDLIEKTQSDNLFIAIKGDWNNDEKNVKSGVYNAKGELIVPVEYFGGIDVIKGKTQDFISIAVNDKYGFMNDKGKIIIEPKYTFDESLKIEEKLKTQ